VTLETAAGLRLGFIVPHTVQEQGSVQLPGCEERRIQGYVCAGACACSLHGVCFGSPTDAPCAA